MSKSTSRKHAVESASAKPHVRTVRLESIPEELIKIEQWVAWRWWRKNGRWTKVPLNPKTLKPAKTNDPTSWGTFAEAKYGLRVNVADGIGFVFTAEAGIVGIDLDDCRDPDTGNLTQPAAGFVRHCDTYAEISPTGTGIKMFVLGSMPESLAKKAGGVEVYGAGRYFTVTGETLDHCPTKLNTLEWVLPEIALLRGEIPTSYTDPRPPESNFETMRLYGLVERARQSAGLPSENPIPPRAPVYTPGPKFVLPPQVKRPAPARLLKLWAGMWEGYTSQSEADLALLGLLAPYCDYDAETLDRWFRVGGLYRKKWDERHASDGSTYGQICIRATLGSAPPPAELVTCLASEVEKAEVQWLWPGFIAYGALTVFDGDPGLGKSTITADLAARLTTGRPMPGETNAAPPAAALLASCEDSAAHTIVPRLDVAGADPSRVRLLLEARDSTGSVRGLQLPDDLALIESRLTSDGAKLLVIDPLMAFLGRDRHGRAIDAHRDQSIRMLMSEFKSLAERTGAAVVIVRHLNKTAGVSAVYRGGGSIGITGAARGVLLAGKHPYDSDRRVLAVVKSNLGPRPLSRVYALTGSGAAVIDWGEPCEIWADDLLTAPNSGAATATVPPWRAAAEWLAEQLSAGPIPAADIIADAATHGWTERILQRARRCVGVATRKTSDGWLWSLGS